MSTSAPRSVGLMEGTAVRVFALHGALPDGLLAGQWLKTLDHRTVEVTCLIDLHMVVSPLHLHTGMFRAQHAYLHQKLKSTFLVDLCYQLGGNKNIPLSLRSFSVSDRTKTVAVVKMVLQDVDSLSPALLTAASEATAASGELGFGWVSQQLEALGQEAPEVWACDAAALTSMFKLTAAEAQGSQAQLEAAVLTRVALKDC